MPTPLHFAVLNICLLRAEVIVDHDSKQLKNSTAATVVIGCVLQDTYVANTPGTILMEQPDNNERPRVHLTARFTLKSLIRTTIYVAILMSAFRWLTADVTVTINNTSTSPLLDLQVHVTGQTYRLGDIASGSRLGCTVRPTSASHVEISYRISDGTTKRHSIDCYFEPGYRGTVVAEIENGELTRSSQRLRLGPFGWRQFF
ncbi:MAG: hypothetical protein ABL921_35305 [Pirellula sp.]